MLKNFFFVVFLLCFSDVFAQDESLKTEAQKKADSIFLNYIRERNATPATDETVDTNLLEQAEREYMDRFVGFQKDSEKELVHKRIIQITLGLALSVILIMGFRKRKDGG
jgi:hypothetical protein